MFVKSLLFNFAIKHENKHTKKKLLKSIYVAMSCVEFVHSPRGHNVKRLKNGLTIIIDQKVGEKDANDIHAKANGNHGAAFHRAGFKDQSVGGCSHWQHKCIRA